MKNILYIAFICSSFFGLQAQENLDKEVIDVVKDFRPKVIQAAKIKSQPLFVDTTKVSQRLNYEIRSEAMGVQQQIDSLHALVLNRPSLGKLYSKQVQLGMGTLLNPHASFNFSNGRSTKNVYYAYIDFDGAFSNQLSESNQYRHTQMGAVYQKPFEILDVEADLGFQTLQRYDSLGHQYSYSIVDFSTQLQSKDSSKVYVPREFHVETDFFFHEAALSEQKMAFSMRHRGIRMVNLPLSIDNSFVVQQSDDLYFTQWKTSLQTQINIQELDVEAGLRVDVLDGEMNIFPQVLIQQSLPKKRGYAYFQLGGDRTLNSLRSLYVQNPYLSLLESTEDPLDLPSNSSYFGRFGLSGSLYKGIGFQLSASANTNSDYVHFVHLIDANVNSLSMIPNYTELNTIQLHAELNGKWNEQLHFWLKGDYHSFNKHLSYVPELELGLYALYHYDRKWLLDLSMRYLGNREVMGLSDLSEAQPIVMKELSSAVDFNVKLKYSYNEKLALYLQGLNLLDEHYLLWKQRPVLGRQINAGLYYSF